MRHVISNRKYFKASKRSPVPLYGIASKAVKSAFLSFGKSSRKIFIKKIPLLRNAC